MFKVSISCPNTDANVMVDDRTMGRAGRNRRNKMIVFSFIFFAAIQIFIVVIQILIYNNVLSSKYYLWISDSNSRRGLSDDVVFLNLTFFSIQFALSPWDGVLPSSYLFFPFIKRAWFKRHQRDRIKNLHINEAHYINGHIDTVYLCGLMYAEILTAHFPMIISYVKDFRIDLGIML